MGAVLAPLWFAGWRIAARPPAAIVLALILSAGVAAAVLAAGVVRAGAAAVQELTYGAYGRALLVSNNTVIDHPYGFPTLTDRSVVLKALGDRVESSAAWRFGVAPTRGPAENANLGVQGVDGAYGVEAGLRLAAGRWIEPADARAARRVCLLGAVAASTLFDSAPALGRSIQVAGISCDVIGVLAPGETRIAAQYDADILAPMSVAALYFLDNEVLGPDEVHRFTVVLKPDADLDQAVIDADLALRRYRGVPQSQVSPFNYTDPAESLRVLRRQQELLRLTLSSVAVITILAAAGGFAAANYSNMRARRRDVCLQLACGGSSGQLLSQTLLEALALGAAGGRFGVAVARGLAWGLETQFGLPSTLTSADWLWPTGLGAGLGVLASLAAAIEAARSDPAEALRA
ncbi:MAG: ABC transporter permease [Maricaulaceae bacterium]